MTKEDMEKTMAFILEQQAQLTVKVDRNAEGIAGLLAIAEIHEREITELRQTQAEAQARTDERLNALINTVERHISEGRNGKA